jgi:hypothetical protein
VAAEDDGDDSDGDANCGRPLSAPSLPSIKALLFPLPSFAHFLRRCRRHRLCQLGGLHVQLGRRLRHLGVRGLRGGGTFAPPPRWSLKGTCKECYPSLLLSNFSLFSTGGNSFSFSPSRAFFYYSSLLCGVKNNEFCVLLLSRFVLLVVVVSLFSPSQGEKPILSHCFSAPKTSRCFFSWALRGLFSSRRRLCLPSRRRRWCARGWPSGRPSAPT